MITCTHGHLSKGDFIEEDDPFYFDLHELPDLDRLMVSQVAWIDQRALYTKAHSLNDFSRIDP